MRSDGGRIRCDPDSEFGAVPHAKRRMTEKETVEAIQKEAATSILAAAGKALSKMEGGKRKLKQPPYADEPSDEVEKEVAPARGETPIPEAAELEDSQTEDADCTCEICAIQKRALRFAEG